MARVVELELPRSREDENFLTALRRAEMVTDKWIQSNRASYLRVFPTWMLTSIKADLRSGLVTWLDVKHCYGDIVRRAGDLATPSRSLTPVRREIIAIQSWAWFRDRRRRGN